MKTLLKQILKELILIRKELKKNNTQESVVPLEINSDWVNSLVESLQEHSHQQTIDSSANHDKQK